MKNYDEIQSDNLTVHAWDVNAYVKLDVTIRQKIHKLIIEKYASFNNFEKYTQLTRKPVSAICKGGFANISRVIKLTDFLGFYRNYIEKHIESFRDSKTGAYNRTYKNIFPIRISPSIIRIVAHSIGDGSIDENGIWYGQKFGVQYMNSLILSLIKPNGELKVKTYSRYRRGKHETFQYVNIPMIFAKVVASCFKIKIKEIKSDVFLDKLLNLPKEFRVQALVALYVDEGAISTKSIRMTNKEVVKAIARIMDSLGYKRSKVTYHRWKGMCFDKYHETDFYEVFLWAEGFLNFYKDVKECFNKYNNKYLGLWHKDKQFEDKAKSIDILEIKYKKEAKYLRDKIIDILTKRKIVILGELAKELDINEDRMYYLLKSLRLNNKIKRLSYGRYALS